MAGVIVKLFSDSVRTFQSQITSSFSVLTSGVALCQSYRLEYSVYANCFVYDGVHGWIVVIYSRFVDFGKHSCGSPIQSID